jgi:ZIP family zinc transporter
MEFQVLIFSVATFAATFLGGLFALRYKDKMHYIMSFAAGVLLGVVGFDLLPEIIDQVNENNYDSMWVMIALVAGFLVFHILEKTILIHHTHEHEYEDHKHPQIGVSSAIALTCHSFLDGMGIGLGFQISNQVGVFIAVAVMSHAFTDGLNNMTLMLSNKNSEKRSKIFLAVHSVAPILGALSTLFFVIPANWLVLYLGFFAGFLLYIGASDILPEAHSEHSSYKQIFLTILGAVFIFVISRLV